MAAPLYPTSQDPTLELHARPTLRLIDGGRSAAAIERRRVFRRRRITVALVAIVAVVSAVQAVQGLGDPLLEDQQATLITGAAPLADPVRADDAPTPPGESGAEQMRTYVVRRGDTLWSIAASLGGDADVRAMVDELSRRVGRTPLQPGQRIDLDGLPGIEG